VTIEQKTTRTETINLQNEKYALSYHDAPIIDAVMNRAVYLVVGGVTTVVANKLYSWVWGTPETTKLLLLPETFR